MAIVPLAVMMRVVEAPQATCPRQRKKRNSDSEDEDYVVEEEVSSKKKVLKKEYGSAATVKPGMHKKAPAKRVPMSKAIASTAETSKPSEEAVGEGKKRKERVKKTTTRVLGRSSSMSDDVAQERKGKSTTDAFKRVPRGPRSAAVRVTDTRASVSAPVATAPVPPPAPTP